MSNENKDKPKKSNFPKPLPQAVIDQWVKDEEKYTRQDNKSEIIKRS